MSLVVNIILLLRHEGFWRIASILALIWLFLAKVLSLFPSEHFFELYQFHLIKKNIQTFLVKDLNKRWSHFVSFRQQIIILQLLFKSFPVWETNRGYIVIFICSHSLPPSHSGSPKAPFFFWLSGSQAKAQTPKRV
jgi:hypothetical protein